MTGRPGYRTMEMIGGSSAPHLARTPCVPLFCTSFNRVGNKERFRLPGAGGGSFPLYGGTFARSYSVSISSTSEPSWNHLFITVLAPIKCSKAPREANHVTRHKDLRLTPGPVKWNSIDKTASYFERANKNAPGSPHEILHASHYCRIPIVTKNVAKLRNKPWKQASS